MTLCVFLNSASGLAGSDEHNWGLRELRKSLGRSAGLCQWVEFDPAKPECASGKLLSTVDSEQVLVILNSAVIVSDSALEALAQALARYPQSCVMPADPRDAIGPWQIDYASRLGFERYVQRRQALPALRPAEGLAPWLFLANAQALRATLEKSPALGWHELPGAMPEPACIAEHAFVHSYADYQKNDRREFLQLIPADVNKLMDVGGGEGGFARAFQQQRNAEVLLVEPNTASSDVARSHGVAVFNGRFESLELDQAGLFDCISFLDVLEHFDHPLGALQHAHRLLRPGGYVALSIPNVGHWSVVQGLLHGRFDYLPVGILCCTHVRFFTERSLRGLLEDANFKVETWHAQQQPLPEYFAQALGVRPNAETAWDLQSLATDSFHVIASRR
ncbi:MAG: class I SAM-dependent methyltransferase [Comamonadaceae bacterium]